MPARAEVRSLQRLASTAVSSALLEAFQALQGEAEVVAWAPRLHALLEEHLQQGLYQELVEQMLLRLDLALSASPGLRPGARHVVPALLGSRLKVLDFTSLRLVADKQVLRSLYSALPMACPALQLLALGQSFFFLPELLSDLAVKLSGLPRLVCLRLHYVATDCHLAGLGASCPRLRELDIKGSGKVGDGSVGDIASCPALTRLDIQGTQITGNGLLEILERCPHLAWVEHCPFNCDSDFKIFKSRKEMLDLIQKGYLQLQELTSQQGSSAKPPSQAVKSEYNIRNFWLFNPKTEELLIALLCPKLEKMRLDFVFQDMNFELDVKPLEAFQHLHTLDLNFYDNHRNPLLLKILSTCGHKIKTLIYNVCADYRSVVDCHNIIARTCPNLTSLSFIGDYKNDSHDDEETDRALARSPGTWPHPHLEELKLGGHCTDTRLAWLLAGAHGIRSIHLDGNLEQLSDESWSSIMANNPLHQLESVWLNTSTRMSMGTIHRLLDHCPRLRSVGRLIHLVEHSGGARRENLLQLLERGKRENWGVEFVWVTPGPIAAATMALPIPAQAVQTAAPDPGH